MNKKKAIIFLCFLLVFVILLIIADISNISTSITFLRNINLDLAGIIWNCFVVIGLYLITFIFVDENAKKKELNQKDACKITLREIYNLCNESVKLLDEDKMVVSAVAKCNFNVPNFQDAFFTHLQNYPFELENQIFSYANTGILTKEEFEKYISIKTKYKDYIHFRITFFDVKNHNDDNSQELLRIIQNKRDTLLCLLNQTAFEDI